MAFSDLDLGLQTILLQDYNDFIKWFVFLLFVFLASFYLFYLWPKQKKTPYLTVVWNRVILLVLSVGYLFSVPLLLLNLSPEYSFYDMYLLPLTFYGIYITIVGIVFFIDFVRWGLLGILALGGLDFGDKNARKLVNMVKDNKHFLDIKWKKN